MVAMPIKDATRSRETRARQAHLRAGSSLTKEARTPEDALGRAMAVRREVLGGAYVDANLADADDFMMAFQDLVTEQVWGRAWAGSALDRRTKSILTLGILAASGRFQEVEIYARGALRCGVSVEEIREALVHVAAYCGAPAGRQAFVAAHAALVEAGALAPRQG